MAHLKGTSIIFSALIAGAATYLSKKENRKKAKNLLSPIQWKVKSMFSSKPTLDDRIAEIAEAAASVDTTKIVENEMIGEGGMQTAIQYYNEKQQQVVH